MRKTTLEFDEAQQAAAAAALGTRGLKATVAASFETVIALQRRRALVEQLASDRLELGDAEVMARAWGP